MLSTMTKIGKSVITFSFLLCVYVSSSFADEIEYKNSLENIAKLILGDIPNDKKMVLKVCLNKYLEMEKKWEEMGRKDKQKK